VQTCQICDLKSVEYMADVLINKLYAAVRGRYGAEAKQHKIAKMKTQLIDALFAVPQNTFSSAMTLQHLRDFVSAQVKGRVSLGLVGDFTAGRADCALVNAMFPVKERRGIMRALIRKNDLSYQFHCTEVHCGADCPFTAHRCPYPNCTERFSLRFWGDHDAQCQYKEVPCAQHCGQQVARRSMQSHMRGSCVMRPAPCPFARLGCSPPGTVCPALYTHRCISASPDTVLHFHRSGGS
jgi:hypothetical protein